MSTTVLDPSELSFLVAARRAILATIDPDGRPRLVPVCFIVETVADERLRLLTPLDDKPKSTDDKRALARVRDIAAGPAVSVLVERWDEDWTRLAWLRLHGSATLVEPADVPGDAVARLRSKYPQYATHDLESSPIIAIEVERATSWGALEQARSVTPTPDSAKPAARAPYLKEFDGTTRSGSTVTEGQIALPIGGRAVSVVGISKFVPFLRIDLFGSGITGTNFRLEIDGPFRIVGKEHDWTIDPQSGPDPAYLGLVDKTIARATAAADGSLEVEFTDGDFLLVTPFEYEPWQLDGDDGTLIVSVAGGGLAVWSPTGETE